MISEFVDRQAANADLYELEDVLTGEKRQYRIVSKATVTVPGTNLNKATLDPILEAILSVKGIADSGGEASTGYWVKFDDGTMICYKRATIMPNVQTAMGDFYRSDYISLGDFPAAFTTLVYIKPAIWNSNASSVYMWCTDVYGPSTTSAGSVAAITNSKFSGLVEVMYTAIGRWK